MGSEINAELVGSPVRTPYGLGILVQARKDGVFVVRLDFDGSPYLSYLQREAVTPVSTAVFAEKSLYRLVRRSPHTQSLVREDQVLLVLDPQLRGGFKHTFVDLVQRWYPTAAEALPQHSTSAYLGQADVTAQVSFPADDLKDLDSLTAVADAQSNDDQVVGVLQVDACASPPPFAGVSTDLVFEVDDDDDI